MSTSSASETTAVFAPSLPSVNLMPPEIAEAARFRRFQFAMAAVVGVAVVLVGVLYEHEHSGVKSAQQQLDAARTQHTVLQQKLTSLASVQDVYTRVAAKEAMLAQALGGEVKWSNYLADLSLRIPDNVWLTGITATEAGASTAPPVQSATPTLTAAGIGTVTFTGVAFSHDDVANWLDMLAKEHGWADPYFTNSTEQDLGSKKAYQFTSSVQLTPAAVCKSCAKPAGS